MRRSRPGQACHLLLKLQFRAATKDANSPCKNTSCFEKHLEKAISVIIFPAAVTACYSCRSNNSKGMGSSSTAAAGSSRRGPHQAAAAGGSSRGQQQGAAGGGHIRRQQQGAAAGAAAGGSSRGQQQGATAAVAPRHAARIKLDKRKRMVLEFGNTNLSMQCSLSLSRTISPSQALTLSPY